MAQRSQRTSNVCACPRTKLISRSFRIGFRLILGLLLRLSAPAGGRQPPRVLETVCRVIPFIVCRVIPFINSQPVSSVRNQCVCLSCFWHLASWTWSWTGYYLSCPAFVPFYVYFSPTRQLAPRIPPNCPSLLLHSSLARPPRHAAPASASRAPRASVLPPASHTRPRAPPRPRSTVRLPPRPPPTCCRRPRTCSAGRQLILTFAAAFAAFSAASVC